MRPPMHGHFQVGGLAPGVYNLLVRGSPRGRRFTARAVEGVRVRAGEDARADLSMIEGGRLHGTAIYKYDNTPMAGAYGPVRQFLPSPIGAAVREHTPMIRAGSSPSSLPARRRVYPVRQEDLDRPRRPGPRTRPSREQPQCEIPSFPAGPSRWSSVRSGSA